jgi:Cu-Zn family superoxide dismutase
MKLILISCLALSLSAAAAWAADQKPLTIDLVNSKGEKVGTATLTQGDHGVITAIHASGLNPGKHGIHFHENGKCEGPDFKSSGGHINPEHKHHGLENPAGPHAGDMPNLDVAKNGKVNARVVSHGVTLGAGEDSLLRPQGASIMIHAKQDDQKSDPAGDSGDRIICGVIPPAPATK